MPKPSTAELKELDAYLDRLRKKKPAALDSHVHACHEEVFEAFDCLTCANCCKTTGPLLTDKDISRISKHLRMKAFDFEQKYLRTDEDGDKVLQQLPCPFLGADHYCQIYEVRPKACREYPHTDRVNFHQITGITKKNIRICPAAEIIVKKLKSRLPL